MPVEELVRVDDPAAGSWDLVVRVQAGDREAFGLIYERYHPKVLRYVSRRVSPHQLAEDLAADVFVRALRGIGALAWQGRDVGAWLMTIARNLVIDHFKSAPARMEWATGDVDEGDRPDNDPAVSPEAAALASLESADLIERIGYLGPDQRQCIALRFLEQMSVAETAQAMGRNEGAVRALQWRALQALRVVDVHSKGRDLMVAPVAPRMNGTPIPVPAMPSAPRPGAMSVESLLAAADRVGHPRLAKQAAKVRDAVAVLRELVEGHEKRAEAEEQVERLRRQLAEAEAKLRGVAGTGPARAMARAAAAGRPEARLVRAWARQQGIECPATGRVPYAVVEAYEAVMSGG